MNTETHSWTQPAGIRARLRRLWDRGLLADGLASGSQFPLRLLIKGPTSREMAGDFAAVRDWVAQWRGESDLHCEWKTISHRLFGSNQIPSAVVFPDLDCAARFLKSRRELETFRVLVESTRSRLPQLVPWMARRPHSVRAIADDWMPLLAVVEWVLAHPRPDRYLRQVDLPGVHTKLLESHRATLTELLDLALEPDSIDVAARGVAGFHRRYGFREKRERIRLRFLDPACAVKPDRLGLDLTIDASAFARLRPAVDRVFITENEINFLSFPDHPHSLILFGSGYGWSALRDADWLHACELHYWGDIDTHGFSILDQLRAILPRAKSLLMDQATFDALAHFHTVEPQPANRHLTRLTPPEQNLYNHLLTAKPGTSPRLEQERVPFSMIESALL